MTIKYYIIFDLEITSQIVILLKIRQSKISPLPILVISLRIIHYSRMLRQPFYCTGVVTVPRDCNKNSIKVFPCFNAGGCTNRKHMRRKQSKDWHYTSVLFQVTGVRQQSNYFTHSVLRTHITTCVSQQTSTLDRICTRPFWAYKITANAVHHFQNRTRPLSRKTLDQAKRIAENIVTVFKKLL